MPLYLADVVQLDPTRSGFYLIVNPVGMTLFVRTGGRLSDRFGSRVIGIAGFGMITAVLLTFSQLPNIAPHWLIFLLLFLFATGTAAGIYSMIRT